MIFASYKPLIASVPITVSGTTDQWRDLFKIDNLPAIPAGTVITIHLRKQLENPSAFPTNIAWLREFILIKLDGSEVKLSLGNRVNTPQYIGYAATLGMNITRDCHYDSTDESCIYVTTGNIPAGAAIVYRGRARTSTIKGYFLKVWDRSAFTVELRPQFDVYQSHINALTKRIEALEAKEV